MAYPAHQVSEESKAEVRALKSFGITDEDIAKYLGISVDTLTKYYKYDLAIGRIKANAEVASKLFKNATENENVTAQIFWLKTRARWRTEDNKSMQESNEEVKREIKELRDKLDAEYKRDY